MKEYYVKDLKKDEDITDFFMVKSIALRIGANKKQYLDISLGDKSGEVSSKKWDVNDTEAETLSQIKEGDIVKVKALVTEWQGITQLRISRIRKSMENDNLQIAEYIKAAPEKSEDMFNYIRGVAEQMSDEDLKKLCLKLLDDNRGKLMYYPAASKNHHAEYGGLLYHIKRMLMTGLKICDVYTLLNRDLVATGVIIHDMEKLNEIEANQLGISPGYSTEGMMLGHLVQGVVALNRIAKELEFSEEKTLMLEHMVLSHHYEPEYGSPKRPMFPEAEVLHYLDILDARLYDMEEALKMTKPGGFSERIWTLDNRRIYKQEERLEDEK